MAVECAAVLIMLLAMGIVIRQKGNRGADLAMIPLYFMPAIYLAAGFAARYLPADGLIQPVPFRIVCYLVALLASGIVMGVLGLAVRRRRTRQMYFVLAGGFNLVLAVIFTLELLV